MAGSELNLSDLLAGESCASLRSIFSQINLGRAPRPGRVRVLTAEKIRALVGNRFDRQELYGAMRGPIPERILVRRRAEVKSCPEIAGAILDHSSDALPGGISPENFDCAAARIPQEASFEVTKTAWDPLLQRWEFVLRCGKAQECVPFLVWARQTMRPRGSSETNEGESGNSRSERRESALPAPAGGGYLVKRGQTAILRWDGGGIRVALPVTCLEDGAPGERVRVRFRNAAQVLRAEILGDGTLRAEQGADRE